MVSMISLVIQIAVILAATQPPGPADVGSRHRTTADSPPDSLVSLSGHIDFTWSVAAAPSYGFSPEFDVTGVPPDGVVKQAFFVTGLWGSPVTTMDLALGGLTSSVAPIAIDHKDSGNPEDYPYHLSGFLVDVSSAIGGNGAYPFELVSEPVHHRPLASLLCVVYEHAALPWREVVLGFGAESLRYSESTASVSLETGGAAELHIFVQADHANDSAGEESISFNGESIACCDVFIGNQGPWGSYFELPVPAQSGPNLVSVRTGEDWIGWHFWALVVNPSPVSRPADTWGKIKSLYR